MAKKLMEVMEDAAEVTGISAGKVAGSATRSHAKKGRTAATKEEQLQAANMMRTKGRKGCHLPRVNMSFTPTNHAFLRVMAHSTGMTVTEFTNYVIDRYRVEHPEIYDKAKEFINFVSDLEEVRKA